MVHLFEWDKVRFELMKYLLNILILLSGFSFTPLIFSEKYTILGTNSEFTSGNFKIISDIKRYYDN